MLTDGPSLFAGILKSFVGLSGSIFTTVYIGAFKPHVLTFLLFLAIGPPLVGLVAVLFVNYVPPPPAETAILVRAPEDSSDSTSPGPPLSAPYVMQICI